MQCQRGLRKRECQKGDGHNKVSVRLKKITAEQNLLHLSVRQIWLCLRKLVFIDSGNVTELYRIEQVFGEGNRPGKQILLRHLKLRGKIEKRKCYDKVICVLCCGWVGGPQYKYDLRTGVYCVYERVKKGMEVESEKERD